VGAGLYEQDEENRSTDKDDNGDLDMIREYKETFLHDKEEDGDGLVQQGDSEEDVT